jgi:hypothetical protein
VLTILFRSDPRLSSARREVRVANSDGSVFGWHWGRVSRLGFGNGMLSRGCWWMIDIHMIEPSNIVSSDDK